MLPTLSLEPTSVNPLSVLNWHPFHPLLRPASFHYLFGPAHRRPLFGLVSFHPLYGRHPPLVWAKILSSFCLDRHTSVLSLDWYPSILCLDRHTSVLCLDWYPPILCLNRHTSILCLDWYSFTHCLNWYPSILMSGAAFIHPLFEPVSFHFFVGQAYFHSFLRVCYFTAENLDWRPFVF